MDYWINNLWHSKGTNMRLGASLDSSNMWANYLLISMCWFIYLMDPKVVVGDSGYTGLKVTEKHTSSTCSRLKWLWGLAYSWWKGELKWKRRTVCACRALRYPRWPVFHWHPLLSHSPNQLPSVKTAHMPFVLMNFTRLNASTADSISLQYNWKWYKENIWQELHLK